jgi:hypothetical protein
MRFLFFIIIFWISSNGLEAQTCDSCTYTLTHVKKQKSITLSFEQEIRISDYLTRYRATVHKIGSDSITILTQRFDTIQIAYQDVEYIKIHKTVAQTLIGGVIRIYSIVAIPVGVLGGTVGTLCFVGDGDYCPSHPGVFIFVPLGILGNRLGKKISGKRYKSFKWQVVH